MKRPVLPLALGVATFALLALLLIAWWWTASVAQPEPLPAGEMHTVLPAPAPERDIGGGQFVPDSTRAADTAVEPQPLAGAVSLAAALSLLLSVAALAIALAVLLQQRAPRLRGAAASPDVAADPGGLREKAELTELRDELRLLKRELHKLDGRWRDNAADWIARHRALVAELERLDGRAASMPAAGYGFASPVRPAPGTGDATDPAGPDYCRAPAAVEDIAAPAGEGVSDGELLRAIQHAAVEVLDEGQVRDTDALTRLVAERLPSGHALRLSRESLRIGAHSRSLAADYNNADFISVAAPDRRGWLLPSRSVNYSHGFYSAFRGDAQNWPDFAEPARCRVDPHGRIDIEQPGLL